MEIDGEEFFKPIFELFGFIKVDENIDRTPEFENADFINIKSRIIVEVKTIEKEYMPNGGIIKETNILLVKPKKINTDGTGQYTIEFNQDKKPQNIIYEPIRRLLKKASRQIKKTEEYFFKDNLGLEPIRIILLVLQRLRMVPIDQVALLVQECLNRGLDNIDCVCICNPFFYSRNPINGRENDRWELVYRKEDTDKIEMCQEFTSIIDAAIKLHYGEPQNIIRTTEE